MSERVDVREWLEFQWPYLMALMGGSERISKLARETEAFVRPRKIENAETLLRLILIWAAAERSLVDTTTLAAEAGLADVSDVALVKRIARSGDWLGALLSELLIDHSQAFPSGVRARLLDATSITRFGKKGPDHRVHLGLDLRSNRIDSIELTNQKGTERLERFAVTPGEIVIGDRGYGHRSGMAYVAQRNAFFLVRFAWSSIPLLTPGGQPFALLDALRSLPEATAGEFPVRYLGPQGQVLEARLVAIRKSEPAAERGRQQVLRDQTRKSRISLDVRTMEMAGFLFVLTNLPPTCSAQSVLQLYRFRWQIEIKFKALKSILHLDHVPARTDESLRVYIFAKLLIALLIDSLLEQAESFSPWGYPLSAS